MNLKATTDRTNPNYFCQFFYKNRQNRNNGVLHSGILYHRNAIISTLIPLPRYRAFIHKVLFENKLVDFVVTVALCPFRGVSKW